ncbi:hypothetical protein BDB01DRAFT_901207 [Pilobolus umbonatus]|nr:hypothetical protein BDB01DRAFT_901207 [Pilobolus umbonatus]
MITNVTRSSKMQERWLGPFIIKGYTSNGSYILEDLTGSLLSRDVPTQQIRLIQSGSKRTPKELKEKHYEVQAIVNHRGTPGNYEYYVYWVGYDDQKKYNTWQTVDTFDSMKPIQDYWARREAASGSTEPSLPQTINKRKAPARKYYSRSKQIRSDPTTRYIAPKARKAKQANRTLIYSWINLHCFYDHRYNQRSESITSNPHNWNHLSDI